MKRYGARLATDMVRRLVDAKVVPGVHFCTLNLEKSVRTILENLSWADASANGIQISPKLRSNKLIEDDDQSNNHALGTSNTALSISPSEASQLAQWGLTNHALPPVPKKGAASAGLSSDKGTVGEDSWDEYPNGRFTDARSPAYGEIDGWGSGLKITVSWVTVIHIIQSRAEVLGCTSDQRLGNADLSE